MLKSAAALLMFSTCLASLSTLLLGMWECSVLLLLQAAIYTAMEQSERLSLLIALQDVWSVHCDFLVSAFAAAVASGRRASGTCQGEEGRGSKQLTEGDDTERRCKQC